MAGQPVAPRAHPDWLAAHYYQYPIPKDSQSGRRSTACGAGGMPQGLALNIPNFESSKGIPILSQVGGLWRRRYAPRGWREATLLLLAAFLQAAATGKALSTSLQACRGNTKQHSKCVQANMRG